MLISQNPTAIRRFAYRPKLLYMDVYMYTVFIVTVIPSLPFLIKQLKPVVTIVNFGFAFLKIFRLAVSFHTVVQ